MTARHRHAIGAPARLAAAAALAAVGLSTQAPAQATHPAVPADQGPQIARHATEISRTPYQQYVSKQNCARGVACQITFSKVPASSRLELTNISCYIEMISTAGPVDTGADLRIPEIRSVQLLVHNSNGGLSSVSTLAPIVVQPNLTWAMNHEVSVFAAGGQSFQFVVTPVFPENLVIFFACHGSGEMVKLQ